MWKIPKVRLLNHHLPVTEYNELPHQASLSDVAIIAAFDNTKAASNVSYEVADNVKAGIYDCSDPNSCTVIAAESQSLVQGPDYDARTNRDSSAKFLVLQPRSASWQC